MNRVDDFYLPINVYILLLNGIISVGDTYMNNGKEKNVGVALQGDPQIENKYKVNYFFAEDSKININEILKKSFLLSLNKEIEWNPREPSDNLTVVSSLK